MTKREAFSAFAAALQEYQEFKYRVVLGEYSEIRLDYLDDERQEKADRAMAALDAYIEAREKEAGENGNTD